MKKLYSLLLIAISSLSFGQTIYSENMGTPSGNTAVATYSTGTAPATFQNGSPISYTGTSGANMMRTSTPSNGYTGFSGSGNVFFAAAGSQFFQITGLNTSGYTASNLQLSFGYLTTTATSQMVVEASTDGTTWTPLTFTNNTNTSWNLVTISGGQIPVSSTLQLKFTAPVTSGGMRIDDVKISNVDASCTIVLGTPVVACAASTSAIDNFTVTVPFTGAGNATYTINSIGTISGDNPTTTAAGNIIITVSESNVGTYTVTVSSSATCSFTFTFTTPDSCIEPLTVPATESFNYAVSTPLNTTQNWKNTSVGSDEILVVSGNLNYTGITSTGNSIALAGTGSDTLLPFTNTTAGTLYTSFLISVTDLTGISTTSSTYFAALSSSTNAFTTARIWFKTDGSQFQYGLSPTTVAADVVWSPTTYSAGTTQYLVLGYDFNTNSLRLYINPTIGGSAAPSIAVTPTTPLTSLANFVLRQDTATTTPAMTVDELKIDTVPNFTLSSKSFDTINGLTIYPNPSNGLVNITTSLNAELQVNIYDMLGKEVANTKVTNNSLNVSNLTSGMYIIKITEEGKTATRKLVIE